MLKSKANLSVLLADMSKNWRCLSGQTFFGLTDKYMEAVYEQFFFLTHHGSWSFIEAYNLPVGLRNWFLFTGEPPKNAMVVEVTGKQFGWIYRYPGKDGSFGKKYYKNIDNVNLISNISKDFNYIKILVNGKQI